MHVITQKRIWEAKAKWPQTATALEAWYRLIKASSPEDFAELKRLFPATDKVGAQKVLIQHMLDHAEYDKGKWRE